MPYFMVDITFCDRGLTAPQRERFKEAMDKMAMSQAATVEHWLREGVSFNRVIWIAEGVTLRGVLSALAVHQFDQAHDIGLYDNQLYTVSLAIRDVSYDVYSSLPSAARRAIKGGRPTREEVAERFRNPPHGA